MFVTADFDKILACIQEARPVLDVKMKPSEFPFEANSPYREGYDWLYVAEQYVMQSLDTWGRPLRFELIGDTGVLSEALSNAFCHGHQKRPDLPIAIQVFLGKKGFLISVTDQGPGFDVQDILSRVAQGKTYYQIAGNGMTRLRDSASFKIFYDHGGKRCNICHLFENTESQGVCSTILKEKQV